MGNGNGGSGFTPAGNHLGANLAFTKFLFLVLRRDDDASRARLRAASGIIARGYFNDFDADGTRETAPHETIQFFVAESHRLSGTGIGAASHAVQVSGKYRPHLQEIDVELRRRLGDTAEVFALDGAERGLRYTSSELYEFAYRTAGSRRSGRVARNMFVLPLSKTPEWWRLSSLERHAYFYPHVDSGRVMHDGAFVDPDAGIFGERLHDQRPPQFRQGTDLSRRVDDAVARRRHTMRLKDGFGEALVQAKTQPRRFQLRRCHPRHGA